MDGKNRFKQFIFGETLLSESSLPLKDIESLIAKSRYIKENGKLSSQDDILEVFSGLSAAWSDPDYRYRREAFDALSRNSQMSAEFIAAALEEFANLISPAHLLAKIEGELGSSLAQGRLSGQKETGIKCVVQPVGSILHVASGNVFLACVESLIDGIITRNINFVKMSTDDRDFPVIFAESIREFDRGGVITKRLAILWWKGGDEAIEKLFKKDMDGIVFWGGVDALKSWEKDLGESVTLVRHGHKISFGVVSRAGLEDAILPDLTDNIALDITMWDQKACNCPQMIFLEGSIDDTYVDRFIVSLTESLDKACSSFPVGRRSDDEYVEVMKARELALAKHLMTGRRISFLGPRTFDWTIIFEDEVRGSVFEPSPLNRTIIIKRYASLDALSDIFKRYSSYLQTVGYCLDGAEVDEYALRLSSIGVTRLCPFGVMAIPTAGAPHDGSFALRELTRVTAVESR